MSDKLLAPIPRLTVLTLGVSDMRASIAFYEALGFTRKFRATGETVAFFATGGIVLGCSRGTNWHRMQRCPTIRAPKPFADRRWPGTAARPKRSIRYWISRFQRALRC